MTMKDIMDYRELLRKYMSHVVVHEGIDYVDSIRGGCLVAVKSFQFSDEEVRELEQISKETEL